MVSNGLEEILDFRKLIQIINDELKSRKIYPIEYLLINGSISEVMDIVRNNSYSYGLIKDDTYGTGIKFSEYLEKYCYYVKLKYEEMYVPSTIVDEDKYYDKLKEPMRHDDDISMLGMRESELQKTLSLARNAIVAYYNVYYNKKLIAELNSGNSVDALEFYIYEQNMLHLLGITIGELRQNSDFIRLTGRREMNAKEILEWLVKDVEGNQDLLDFTVGTLSKNNCLDFNLVKGQLSSRTRILNFHKLRARSQAFLKYGPFENVSLVVKLNNNRGLTVNGKSNTAMITEAKVFRKYPWAYFGMVQNPNEKYMETLLLDSNRGKRLLVGGSTQYPRAYVVTSVDDGSGGGGHIFSEEEQFELVAKAYESFGDVVNFEHLIDYFNNLGYGNTRDI